MIKKRNLISDMRFIVLIITGFVAFVKTQNIKFINDNSCKTLDGENGNCIPIIECSEVDNWLKKSNYKTRTLIFDMIKEIHCGFEGSMAKICCPSANSMNSSDAQSELKPSFEDDFDSDTSLAPPDVSDHQNLHLLPQNCGDFDESRIFNGDTTGVYDFPWMALISYRSEKGSVSFRCGGTIINNKHILTAAHCVTYLGKSTLAGIRVGEHDYSTEEDCEGNSLIRMCTKYEDFNIEKVMIHPNFVTPRMDDIAIIRLQNPIIFKGVLNKFPICLPVEKKLANEELENKYMVITGWGITEKSRTNTDLMKASVPVMTKEKCDETLKRHGMRESTKKQICADSSNGTDSAKGDSGGPLQKIDEVNGIQRYVQHGIISYGLKRTLSVNTRISYYMNWILDQLE